MELSGKRDRARWLEFFFGDYLDSAGTVLEVGNGGGWLEEYLVGAGFRDYRRMGPMSASRSGGDSDAQRREQDLAPASVDLLIALDARLDEGELQRFRDLIKPGGLLFAVRPGERLGLGPRLRHWLAVAAGRGREELAEIPEARGFRVLAAQRQRSGELWLRLQRLAEEGE